jgi:general secretion pathway protein L
VSAAAQSSTTRRAGQTWQQRFLPYWRWWVGELAQMLPARFGALRGIASAPFVALEGEELVLRETRAQGLADIARVPLANLDAEGRKLALRNLLAGAGAGEPRLRLCLGRDDGLLRRVTLPLATEENLGQVLAFEMDRLTPFRATDVHFGFRVAGRDVAAGKVQVDLGMARKEIVDARLARLREWGGIVEGVVLAEDLGRSSSPIDLMPDAERASRAVAGDARARIAAIAGVAILFVIVLVLPLYQKREQVKALLPLVDKARAEAEATDALARQLERQVGDYNFLLAKKHSMQPALALVEELSRLLPDHTWVQQLDIRTAGKVREVQISGETVSSSKLIELLEQATTLTNAAPRGTVTRGSQPGTERFLIAAETKTRPLPEAIPAAQAAAPAPPVQPPASTPQPAATPAEGRSP